MSGSAAIAPSKMHRGILLWTGYMAVLALTVAAYLPCLKGPFTWDGDAIAGNPLLTRTDGLFHLWLHPSLNFHEGHYWPVTYTTLWAAYQLWGLNVAGYHLLNLCLHLANSTLVFLLLRRLHVFGATFVAAIFAVHPIHVEAVAWIIQTKELLATMLALLSGYMFVRAAEDERFRLQLLSGSVVAYLIAILSKSSALPLPVCLTLVLLWKWPRWRGGYLAALLMLLTGLCVGTADWMYSRREHLPAFTPVGDRLLVALQAIGWYVGRLVVPLQVQALFPPLRPSIGGAAIVATLLLGVTVSLLRLRWRGIMVGLGSYLLLLSLTLGLIPFGFQRFTNIADRFQYLPSVPGLALVGGGLLVCARRALHRSLHLPAAVALLLLLASQTARQSLLWSDAIRFWSSAYAAHRESSYVATNYGRALAVTGHYQEAIAVYQNAIRHDPENAQPLLNLGVALAETGKIEEAAMAYHQAIQLRPDLAEAHYNIGLVHKQKRNLEAAEQAFRKTLAVDPHYADARLNLAALLVNSGRFTEGTAEIRKVLRLDPGHLGARQMLAALNASLPPR